MPELPEVETVRLQLEQYVVGHTINRVEVNYERAFEGDASKIIGAKIQNIKRIGKVLVFELDNKQSIAVHIKMTGQFIYRGPNLPDPPPLSSKVLGGVPGKHTHVIFRLNNGGTLYYNDVRKFGWIKVVPTSELSKISLIDKMGPEPLGQLTIRRFREILGTTTRSVKVVLMDQSMIGGVGNIYANDALFLAKVFPGKKANMLNQLEQEKLFAAVCEVIDRGIKFGGASENSFVRPDGTAGEYQEHTVIYGRKDTICPECGMEVKKIKLGGRGTYYCPGCQKK